MNKNELCVKMDSYFSKITDIDGVESRYTYYSANIYLDKTIDNLKFCLSKDYATDYYGITIESVECDLCYYRLFAARYEVKVTIKVDNNIIKGDFDISEDNPINIYARNIIEDSDIKVRIPLDNVIKSNDDRKLRTGKNVKVFKYDKFSTDERLIVDFLLGSFHEYNMYSEYFESDIIDFDFYHNMRHERPNFNEFYFRIVYNAGAIHTNYKDEHKYIDISYIC